MTWLLMEVYTGDNHNQTLYLSIQSILSAIRSLFWQKCLKFYYDSITLVELGVEDKRSIN